MTKQTNPDIKGHLLSRALYVLLLLAVCAVPFALGKRNSAQNGFTQKTPPHWNLPESQRPDSPTAGRSQLAPGPAIWAYVPNAEDDTVSVIDTSSDTVVATVGVGTRPYGVAVKADGSRAYVTNQFSHNVSVIDTCSNTVVATVAVGGNPIGVAMKPDGIRAYVANAGNNTVSVIDTSNNTVVATVGVVGLPVGVR